MNREDLLRIRNQRTSIPQEYPLTPAECYKTTKMKLIELNPREKFYIDNKGGIFEKQAATTSIIDNRGGFVVKCNCCNSLQFMENDTEVFTLEYESPIERYNIDKGYEFCQETMINYIQNWNGKTNSALGELLSKKFNEMLLKRYESHKSPNQ